MLDFGEVLTGGANRLSHVYRFSSLPCSRREAVSEHSWYVTFYAYCIGKELLSRGLLVDLGVLLSRAMLHDLDESHTGDFLRIVKYGHPALKGALDSIAEAMMKKLTCEIGIEFRDDWKNAKAPDLEGFIVEVADFARVVSYIIEEVRSGNMHLAYILEEVCSYLQELKSQTRWAAADMAVMAPIIDSVILVARENMEPYSEQRSVIRTPIR